MTFSFANAFYLSKLVGVDLFAIFLRKSSLAKICTKSCLFYKCDGNVNVTSIDDLGNALIYYFGSLRDELDTMHHSYFFMVKNISDLNLILLEHRCETHSKAKIL